MEPGIRAQFEASLRITRIVHMAFIVYLFIYAALVLLIQASFTPFRGFAPSAPLYLLRPLFYVLSFLIFGLILLLKRRLLQGERLKGQEVQKLVATLKRGHIALFALSEAPALYGLVLFLLHGWAEDFFLLAFLAFFYLLIVSPRRERWEEAIGGRATG